jgi:hypothetical protein
MKAHINSVIIDGFMDGQPKVTEENGKKTVSFMLSNRRYKAGSLSPIPGEQTRVWVMAWDRAVEVILGQKDPGLELTVHGTLKQSLDGGIHIDADFVDYREPVVL